MMLFRITSAILLLLSGNVSAQEVFADPISEFLDRNPRSYNQGESIEKLFLVSADISGDGQPEIFLSHKDMYVDRPGRAWIVYTPVNGRYRRIDNVTITRVSGEKRTHQGLIRFRTDAFHVGKVDGVEGTNLFSYWPAGSGRGGLIGIYLENGALVTRKVRDMLVGHDGRDSELYKRLFVTGMGEITKAKVEDLATEEQRLALIGVSIDPREPSGFVSRPLGRLDSEAENSALTAQETLAPADAPSVQAASDEKAEQPTAAAALTQSEEPESSPKSKGIVPISIGAVVCLLAFAGYRAFSKKDRSEP